MEAPAPQSRLTDLAPGIVAAIAFALADVFGKVTFVDGSDVLTLSTFRGVVTVAFMAAWLRLDPPPIWHTPRQRNIALGLGLLFAAIVFGLFKAIQLMPVPVAILSYFIYPLLTGISGALLGIEKLSWRGASAAVVALIGLALTVGAESKGIVLAGLGFAVGASCCRTAVLLITRAKLPGADARLITWYSLVSSTAVFLAISLATWNWTGPQTAYGWFALVVVSIATLIAVLSLFVAIERVGPFRSALIMNLEPLLATILSAWLLGEVITPLQGIGGAIMLTALVVFQLRR